jgi:hypothetical protein
MSSIADVGDFNEAVVIEDGDTLSVQIDSGSTGAA